MRAESFRLRTYCYIALKQRVEELERLNSKWEQKILKLKETAALVKKFSLKLALIEKDVQSTQATSDRDAGHIHTLLNELRFAIQKQFSSEARLRNDTPHVLCSLVDQVSRALASSDFPRPAVSNASDVCDRCVLVTSFAGQEELAATGHDQLSKHNRELVLKLSQRAREAQQTRQYTNALEYRLSFLEAEIALLRSQACSATPRNVHSNALPPPSLRANGESVRHLHATAAKPLQGNVFLKI